MPWFRLKAIRLILVYRPFSYQLRPNIPEPISTPLIYIFSHYSLEELNELIWIPFIHIQGLGFVPSVSWIRNFSYSFVWSTSSSLGLPVKRCYLFPHAPSNLVNKSILICAFPKGFVKNHVGPKDTYNYNQESVDERFPYRCVPSTPLNDGLSPPVTVGNHENILI